MNTERKTGTLKSYIKCIKGDFEKDEKVYLKPLPFGNYEIYSLDGQRMGFAAQHEVDTMEDKTSS